MSSLKQKSKLKKQQCLMANFFAGGATSSSQNDDSSSFSAGASTHSPSQQNPPPPHSKRRRRAVESGFGDCPLCQKSFPFHRLESHAAACTGGSESSSSEPSKKRPPMTATAELKEPLVEVTPQQQPAAQREKTESQLSPPRTVSLKDVLKPKKIQNPIVPDEEPIPGLFMFYNFISPDEEQTLLKFLDHEGRWRFSKFNGNNIGKRWGVHCNLRDRRVDAPEIPLPEVLKDLIFPKLARIAQMKGCIPNEANSIDYRRKQGHWLHPHVDDRKLSKEPIANLSLAGDCTMTFRNVGKHRNLAASEYRNHLPRRCLQILTGAARYDFSHGISHADLASDRRVSITMRESPLTASTKTETFHTASSATPSVQTLWKGEK